MKNLYLLENYYKTGNHYIRLTSNYGQSIEGICDISQLNYNNRFTITRNYENENIYETDEIETRSEFSIDLYLYIEDTTLQQRTVNNLLQAIQYREPLTVQNTILQSLYINAIKVNNYSIEYNENYIKVVLETSEYRPYKIIDTKNLSRETIR